MLFVKKQQFTIAMLFLFATSLQAQDSVDVTFRYKGNQQSFLVGEFNGWDNSIWPMSYNGSEWARTQRLPIGGNPSGGVAGAWQYKFYYNGASPWPNDPLNHHVNSNDNLNSFLYTKDPTIYHFLPNQRLGVLESGSLTISAYIFPKVGSKVDTSAITLDINGTLYENLGAAYNFAAKKFQFTPPSPLSDGSYRVILNVGTNADTVTFSVLTSGAQIMPMPDYAQHGVTLPNATSNDSTTFRLRAGATNYVLLRVVPDGQSAMSAQPVVMRKDNDSDNWWINLEQKPGTYKYLYETDSGAIINDPWGRWTADDGASQYTIGPQGLTADNYSWQSNDFVRPPLNQLIIYELHIGEFAGGYLGMNGGEAGFSEMITRLPYLDSLGVNAIELMPVNDFGGRGASGHSWGYDLNSYFALEPSYGTPAEFKALVDSAHARGIAIIVDVVFNHLNDTASLWQMLPDANANPYFKQNNDFRPNEDALFFFRDMDHWAPETQEIVYASLKMWLDEYRVDGFRYDFTQGIGWSVSEPDKGIPGWANRIAQDYGDRVYQIAEHLPESPALVFNTGLTGGWHDSFRDEVFDEARFRNTGLAEIKSLVLDLGAYQSNDTPSTPRRYGDRTQPVNMTVSHDEQSLIFEMTTFQGVTVDEAVKRDKLYATLMFTSLGIPMLWQGIEFSEPRGWRSDDSKLSYRPVDWRFLQTARGRAHYDYYAALIRHRKRNPALYRGQLQKIQQYDSEKILVWGFADSVSTEQVVIAANFKSSEQTIANVQWLATGEWHNVFDQSVFPVTQIPIPSLTIPGYTALVFASSPDSAVVSVSGNDDKIAPATFQLHQNYPNPFNPETNIVFELSQSQSVAIDIYNLQGQRVRTLLRREYQSGVYQVKWNGLSDKGIEAASGIYLIHLKVGDFEKSVKAIKLK